MDIAKKIADIPTGKFIIFIAVFAFTAWLVMPMITMEKVELRKSMEYFYRAAGGVVIMIILFGKTVTDLLFSQDLSRRKSWTYMGLLTFYSIALAGGIIFIAVRILLLYLNANSSSFTGAADNAIQYVP
jgi:hypothetical protein